MFDPNTYIKHESTTGINIDTTYRCVFRCSQCLRQQIGGTAVIKRSHDLAEKDFQKILDFYHKIHFCGQISDPIYHPRFLKLLEICEGIRVVVSTVGSGKSDDWWDQAFSYNKDKTQWTFGVDGINEKSEIYRIGSNFKDTWNKMQKGVSLGQIIVWQYIVFDYNEQDMDEAIKIAKDNNFVLMFRSSNRSFDNTHYRFDVKHGPSNKLATRDGGSADYYVSETMTEQFKRFRNQERNNFKQLRRYDGS